MLRVREGWDGGLRGCLYEKGHVVVKKEKLGSRMMRVGMIRRGALRMMGRFGH